MENQHRLIKGYRDLTPEEIELVNRIKEQGVKLLELVELLENNPVMVDKRWLAIGTTDLQKGLMALTRSVTKPGFF